MKEEAENHFILNTAGSLWRLTPIKTPLTDGSPHVLSDSYLLSTDHVHFSAS